MKKVPLYELGLIIDFKVGGALHSLPVESIRLVLTKRSEYFEYGVKGGDDNGLVWVREKSILSVQPNLFREKFGKKYFTVDARKTELDYTYEAAVHSFDKFFADSNLNDDCKKAVISAIGLVDSVREKLDFSGLYDIELGQERFDVDAASDALLRCPRYFFQQSIDRLMSLNRRLRGFDGESVDLSPITDSAIRSILYEYDRHIEKKVNSACADYDNLKISAENLANNEYIGGLYSEISQKFNAHVGIVLPKRSDYLNFEDFKKSFTSAINTCRYKNNLIINNGQKIDWTGSFPAIGDYVKYIPQLKGMPVDLLTYKSEIEKEFVRCDNFLDAVTKVNRKYGITDDEEKSPYFGFYFNEVYKMNQLLLEDVVGIGNVVREENNCRITLNYDLNFDKKSELIGCCENFGGMYDYEKDIFNIPNEYMARRFLHSAEKLLLNKDLLQLKNERQRQNISDDFRFHKKTEVEKDTVRKSFEV